MIILKNICFSICALMLMFSTVQVFAQSPAPTADDLEMVVETPQEDISVPLFDEPTHPPVKLSPDKSKLIRFDETVERVIVGNPIHLAVLPSDEKTVVLVARAPGATYFTAMNDKGEIVMQRHVFIAAPQENYVRIRQTCAASELDNCQETQVYYCPDTCHNVALSGQEEAEDEASVGAPTGTESEDQVPPNEVDSASD